MPDPIDSPSARLFDDFVAAISSALGRAGYFRDRFCDPWSETKPCFLILAGVMYPFKTRRTLTAAVLTFAATLTPLVVGIFASMARRPHLSRLQGKPEDENPLFDPTLVRGLLLHGVLPVAALLAVRFPSFGRVLLGGWEPLTFALGK